MGKRRIFTIGFDLPGDDFEYIEFNSDATLLDADIILFKPTLGDAGGSETYNGKTLLREHDSFSVKRCMDHWHSEIIAAIKAGKLVVVYLVKPRECYRYTGRNEYSGTGRSRVTTNIVTEVSSYEAVPKLKSVVPKTGSEMRLEKEARHLTSYWAAFGKISPYEVQLEGEFKRVLLKSKTGDRVVGVEIRGENGTLLCLPPLGMDDSKFTKRDQKTGDVYWTSDANKFGKKLVAELAALADSMNRVGDLTPPPSWTEDSSYRLVSEGLLEAGIAKCSGKIAKLAAERDGLQENLAAAGKLRDLLFEQGKPLESAVIQALRLMGFAADGLAENNSEFDAVFASAEGRCLGEAEGKDSKAINIDKFSQLERNLQEDFARDGITEFAKGVIFGNAYRLTPIEERQNFFTDKCISAAKRVKAALVRTPDMFVVAKYLEEYPDDEDFKSACRNAIFSADGNVVIFPSVHQDQILIEAE